VWVDVPDSRVEVPNKDGPDAGVAVLRQRHARGAVLPAWIYDMNPWVLDVECFFDGALRSKIDHGGVLP